MSEGPKRRRWFQFSLRMVLLGVALLGCLFGWLAWNFSRVRERNALEQYFSRGVMFERITRDGVRVGGKVPLIWKWLGAKSEDFNSILLPEGEFSQDEINRLRACYPEVTLWQTFPRTGPPWSQKNLPAKSYQTLVDEFIPSIQVLPDSKPSMPQLQLLLTNPGSGHDADY